MQVGEDRISSFLGKKFRLSKNHFTKSAYGLVLKRFVKFLKGKYNSDIDTILEKITSKEIDALDVLDNYYTFMTVSKKNDAKLKRQGNSIQE